MEMLLEPVAPAQSILYRYLTEGFSRPDSGRLEYLANMVSTVQAACEEMLETGEATRSMPDIAGLERSVAAARKGSLEDLQAEYTRLFVMAMPATPVRLLESVQREGMLVGDNTEEVATTYLRFGLEAKQKEPDHLTAELEFLAYLTGTPVESGQETERYRRARLKFLREHLLQWGTSVAIQTQANTTEPLYLALAALLDWLLAAEAELKV